MAKLVLTYFRYRLSDMLVEQIGNKLSKRPLSAKTIRRQINRTNRENGLSDLKIESLTVLRSQPTNWEA